MVSDIKAVIFDLDGTLYRQKPLQRAMLARLLRAHALHPLRGLRTARALSAYRKAQEELRHSPVSDAAVDLAGRQLALACERSGVAASELEALVSRWIDREPLPFLAGCAHPGVVDLLSTCRSSGLRLGLLSDYPAEDKLAALGVRDLFDVILSAQAAEVGVFKPNPRGLLIVAQRLGVAPADCLYVGDREEVDGRAAIAAGMPYVIVKRGLHDVLRRLNHYSTGAERTLMSPQIKI